MARFVSSNRANPSIAVTLFTLSEVRSTTRVHLSLNDPNSTINAFVHYAGDHRRNLSRYQNSKKISGYDPHHSAMPDLVIESERDCNGQLEKRLTSGVTYSIVSLPRNSTLSLLTLFSPEPGHRPGVFAKVFTGGDPCDTKPVCLSLLAVLVMLALVATACPRCNP